MSPGALRRRLQWPRGLVAAIDVLALALGAATICASYVAMEAETDTPFIVAQALLAAAVPLLALAVVLAVTRIGRARLDVVMAVAGSGLLVATVLVGWVLCFTASLGGEPCWWEDLDVS